SFVFFFFFSSRRRHTRFSRDWSSDVCSSDLGSLESAALLLRLDAHAVEDVAKMPGHGVEDAAQKFGAIGDQREQVVAVDGEDPRSEERRVGKEWRARWGREQ